MWNWSRFELMDSYKAGNVSSSDNKLRRWKWRVSRGVVSKNQRCVDKLLNLCIQNHWKEEITKDERRLLIEKAVLKIKYKAGGGDDWCNGLKEEEEPELNFW